MTPLDQLLVAAPSCPRISRRPMYDISSPRLRRPRSQSTTQHPKVHSNMYLTIPQTLLSVGVLFLLVAIPTHARTTTTSQERAHFMRATLHTLQGPCPRNPFTALIVNHTASPATIVCTGSNSAYADGYHPVMHGEMAAIMNCSRLLSSREAWADLSIYTDAESCPMCAAAIRWAGMREYIYGTSVATLLANGWPQITIDSDELFARSTMLTPQTELVSDVLANETDPMFAWQFRPQAECPKGCHRAGTDCVPVGGEDTPVPKKEL
ncbi:cytidine deaminase-like protein [Tricharina praecox]|uniref:cytidine deaminase-like protein n=1 Tax=Tricharina praecox TaxID=43433 RepID=UPI00221FC7E6|nr:cytidine deaminase-like protein [Tricharina praecox]KAI5844089.1 cytidine deaminase-like protein [Tricharina praecox]